jgi:hypothetical protein
MMQSLKEFFRVSQAWRGSSAWGGVGRRRGAVVVFFCVVAVVLLVFVFSVLNLGVVVNEKIDLQNAADFAILSGSTWQARAMNMQALFNNTISAGIILQVAHSLMTGVEPEEMPPAWIRIQQSSQRWIQDSFNTYLYKDSSGVEYGGFGAWMAALTSQANGGYPIAMQPFHQEGDALKQNERIPLYAYRYRFYDAEERVNPVLGTEAFLDFAPPYIPNVSNPDQGNAFYRVSGASTLPSDSRPYSPEGSGYIKWEHTMTLKSGSDGGEVWPTDQDLVTVWSGGHLPWDSSASFSDQFQYSLIEDQKLSLEKQIEWAEQLKAHIKSMIDKSDVTGLAVYNVDSQNIKEHLKEYIEKEFPVDPASSQFKELFEFSEKPLTLSIPIQKKESVPPTEDNQVVGHLVMYIVPNVTVGVNQNEVRGQLFHRQEGEKINDFIPARYRSDALKSNNHESAQPYLRYFDTMREREFWFRPAKTALAAEYPVIEGEYPGLKRVSDGEKGTTYEEFPAKKAKRGVRLPCGSIKYGEWVENINGDDVSQPEGTLPTRQQAFKELWGDNYELYYKYKDGSGSDKYEYHKDFNHVVKRRWYYYSFGVQFDVTITAFMNIDFSTLFMAKYTTRTHPWHLSPKLNDSTANMVKRYKYNGVRRLSSCFVMNRLNNDDNADEQALLGQSLFRRDDVPDSLEEIRANVRAGTIPQLMALSIAETWQKGNGNVDIANEGGGLSEVMFKMNWYSRPYTGDFLEYLNRFE